MGGMAASSSGCGAQLCQRVWTWLYRAKMATRSGPDSGIGECEWHVASAKTMRLPGGQE